MRSDRQYYVYILSGSRGTLYIGVTNDLVRRMNEHRQALVKGFTQKYKVKRLIYYEETSSIEAAIEREKQIKGWRRERKLALVKSVNPRYEDLAEDWFED